jgi:hypothetical protein
MQINIKHFVFFATISLALIAPSAQGCKLGIPSKLAGANRATPAASIDLANTLPADDDKTPPQGAKIVGMWLAEFIAPEGTDLGFDSFYADGNELLVDQSDPRTDNVCTGVWEETGPLTYKLNHPSWDFDTNGNLVALVVFSETITLDRTGNRYTGTYSVTAYDPSDPTLTTILGQGGGTLKGTRITAHSKPL